MRNPQIRPEITLPSHLERQRWWAVGRQQLSTESEPERRWGAQLVAQDTALPPDAELDESLCRRAGIPVESLDELRGAGRMAA